MAKSDFLKDAKEAYKKRFPNKDRDSLSDGTKKKYYYEAMGSMNSVPEKPRIRKFPARYPFQMNGKFYSLQLENST